MKTYRVIDLRHEAAPGIAVHAHTAEGAASQILGMDLIRGGNKRALVAKVYSTTESGLTMVRLYQRTESDAAPHT